MSEVRSGEYCGCICHTGTGAIHVAPCCDGECGWCGRFIAAGQMKKHVKAHEELQIQSLARTNCKSKHPEVYDSLKRDGANSPEFASPCAECLEAERTRYYQKKQKAHGRRLTPEEEDRLFDQLSDVIDRHPVRNPHRG